MPSTFKTLSDLVADAEDLSARLEHSLSPNIRELKHRVDASIDDVRKQFKRRMKATRRSARGAGLQSRMVLPATAITVAVTLGLLYMVFAHSDDR